MKESGSFSKPVLVLFALLAFVVGPVVAIVAAELVARAIAPERDLRGENEQNIQDPYLGWLPNPGILLHRTGEFTVTYDINDLNMNDAPLREDGPRPRQRIAALGDSHTFAIGVSQRDTWPNVLEELLFHGDAEEGTVYNLGVIGYNVGQYLYQLRRVRDRLQPTVVLIGFSMATDLFDLIPPRLGGFVYGSGFGRVYFDLDADENLVEHRELIGQNLPPRDEMRSQGQSSWVEISSWMRTLRRSALYRRFRRSKLAFWASVRFATEDRPLWYGMDTALKKELKGTDRYRWVLAEKIIALIAEESKAIGAEVYLVNIPYLAQVYDDVWAISFGAAPERYDRWIASERMGEICRRLGIGYIDTTEAFVRAARERSRWLHYRVDNHPTAEGHRLIAETVAKGLVGLPVVDGGGADSG